MSDPKNASKSEIRRALGLLCDPDATYELRVVKHRLGVIAGFYDDLDKLAEAAYGLTEAGVYVPGRFKPEQVCDVGSVYVTLNPVRSVLLAREGMDNQLRVVPGTTKEKDAPKWTASDADVIRRRLILIDFDPWRDREEISTTDEGHLAGIQRAVDVRGWLAEQGWNPGILADSGNGGHLVYGCDLPNDDDARGLIQSLLQGLAGRFGDECVKGKTPHNERLIDLDTSVFNAARICTLWGTWKRKGSPRPDRPHRLSRILDAPEALSPIPAELLRDVVERLKPVEKTTVDMGAGEPGGKPEEDIRSRLGIEDDYRRDRREGAVAEVLAKLRSWGLEPGEAVRKGDWTHIPIGPCLFVPDEHTKPVTINVHKDGGVAYGCFGGRCSGKHEGVPRKNWRDVRAHFGDIRDEVSESGVPAIMTTNRQLRDLTREAIEAIEAANNPPRWFRRGGVPVRILEVEDERGGVATQCQPMGMHGVRNILAEAADWYRIGAKEAIVSCFPPDDVVESVLATPGWRLPPVHTITDVPVFSRTGTLIRTPGYDRESRLWYRPGPGLEGLEIPDNPSKEEVREAVDLLRGGLWADFPFAKPAYVANLMGLLLAVFVRPMIDGASPLHVIEAPEARTGKGLLLDTLTITWTGRRAVTAAECHSDEEWNKSLTGLLLGSPTYVAIDNVNSAINSGAFAKILTDETHQSRLLGTNAVAELQVRCLWIATGNNVHSSKEIAGRFVKIRLDAQCETPGLRPVTQFRHPELRRWAKEHRKELVAACLTIVQAWIAAGQPRGRATLGGYEEFVKTIGGILEVAGVEGYLSSLADDMPTINTADADWRRLVREWHRFYGDDPVTAKQVLDIAGIHDLLLNTLSSPTERGQQIQMANALGKAVDRVFGGLQIRRYAEKDRHGSIRYHLAGVETSEAELPGPGAEQPEPRIEPGPEREPENETLKEGARMYTPVEDLPDPTDPPVTPRNDPEPVHPIGTKVRVPGIEADLTVVGVSCYSPTAQYYSLAHEDPTWIPPAGRTNRLWVNRNTGRPVIIVDLDELIVA